MSIVPLQGHGEIDVRKLADHLHRKLVELYNDEERLGELYSGRAQRPGIPLLWERLDGLVSAGSWSGLIGVAFGRAFALLVKEGRLRMETIGRVDVVVPVANPKDAPPVDAGRAQEAVLFVEVNNLIHANPTISMRGAAEKLGISQSKLSKNPAVRSLFKQMRDEGETRRKLAMVQAGSVDFRKPPPVSRKGPKRIT